MFNNLATLAWLGPAVRQFVQWGAGALLGVGLVTETDIAAISGGIVSLINLAYVVYHNRKPKS